MIRSDSCGLDNLLAGFDAAAVHDRLMLGGDWLRRWVGSWRFDDGVVSWPLRDMNSVPLDSSRPVRRFTWRARQRHQQDDKLARLAGHLATLPQTEHVDYRQRRERFALWHLPGDDFEGLLDALIAGIGRPSPAPLDRLHEALSAIIWHRITGSELVLAPCFRAPLSPAGRIVDRHSPPVSLARRIRQAPHRSPYRTLLPALDRIMDSLLDGPAPACPSQSVTTERPSTAN